LYSDEKAVIGLTGTTNPLLAGKIGSISVTGAFPNSNTILARSLQCLGTTAVPSQQVRLDFQKAQKVERMKTADHNSDLQ